MHSQAAYQTDYHMNIHDHRDVESNCPFFYRQAGGEADARPCLRRYPSKNDMITSANIIIQAYRTRPSSMEG